MTPKRWFVLESNGAIETAILDRIASRVWASGARPEEVGGEPVVADDTTHPEAVRRDSISKLTIESNPPGAEVLIDGKSYGRTPATVSLPPGSRYVVLRRDGYNTWSRELQAKPAESMTISADLKPLEETPNVIVVKPTKKLE